MGWNVHAFVFALVVDEFTGDLSKRIPNRKNYIQSAFPEVLLKK